ncbi:MAG: flagellar motility protein MotE (MotC chaperone) [Chlamydiales bacterium]|jgi:flagellar motility protein MotE (MotC chaperone)
MNNILKYLAFASGGVVLFFSSFLAFAAMSGTPPHELAVIGALFPSPEEPNTDENEPANLMEEVAMDDRPEAEVIESAASPLRAFLLESPFSTDELEQLQSQMKNGVEANNQRAIDFARREAELKVRERQLDERWEELVKIRTTLIEHDLELELREDELTRDERAQEEREEASWSSMSKIFENGKVDELAANLIMFLPDQAAQILRGLTEERASELINALPRDRYLEYADSYRKAGL